MNIARTQSFLAAHFKNLWHSRRRRVWGLVVVAAALPRLALAEPIYGLVGSNRIVTFDSATPAATLTDRAITGLSAGDVLVGLDLRPAIDRLYSLSTSGNLYRIDDAGASFTALLVGNIGVPLIGSNFGFDFNPVPDRLRVVTDGDQNLRLNPNNAVAIVDGSINPSDLNIVALAYSENYSGATMTTLFGIDTLTAGLVRASVPNAGTFVSVGSLGLGAIQSNARIGFDISGTTGIGYLGINDWLYTVDLSTGAATSIGSIGVSNIRGLTVGPRQLVSVPEPATWSALLLGIAVMGLPLRRRFVTRSRTR